MTRPIFHGDFAAVRGLRGLRGLASWSAAAGLYLALIPTSVFAGITPAESSSIVGLRDEAVGYEHGAGVPKDISRAVALYCKAARLGDAESQFALGWIYAYGRGVPRNDSIAAFFFAAAAEQGVEQAPRMLQLVGGPATDVPECMVEAAVAVGESDALGAAAPPPFQIDTSAPKILVDLVRKMAPAYGIEPQLVLAVMKAESNFDRSAVSPKNAMGLMQLLPETAARFRIRNPFDPKQNIRGGLAYLRWLLAYFEGDLTLVTAAYNAGERTVERYRGVPPYAETRGYVRRIIEATGSRVHPFDASVTLPSPALRLIRQPEPRSASANQRLVSNF